MNTQLTANELEAQARELADRALIQITAELAAQANTATDDGVESQSKRIRLLADSINLKLLRSNQTFADFI